MGLGAFCSLVSFLFLFCEASISSNDSSGLDYGVVYDAGSVHTTVSVYAWSKMKLNGTGVVKEVASCEIPVARGISSFYSDPQSVKNYILVWIAKCIGFNAPKKGLQYKTNLNETEIPAGCQVPAGGAVRRADDGPRPQPGLPRRHGGHAGPQRDRPVRRRSDHWQSQRGAFKDAVRH